MSEEVTYPQDSDTFANLLGRVQELLLTDVRLPAWPFRMEVGNADICQYSHAIEGTFGPVLQALAEDHGDETVTLVVLEPTPSYYRENYAHFPAFRISVQGIADAYWDAGAYEPLGDPTGAVIYTADVVALVGDSGSWAVWAERSWDVAIVMSKRIAGPWLSGDVPFVPVETALSDFTEPDFKVALSADVRTAFLKNVRERGTMA